MEFEIFEGQKLSLDKVTPRKLKRLIELGFDYRELNPAKAYPVVLNIWIDSDDTTKKEIVEIIFGKQVEGDYNEIDLGQLGNAVLSFFIKSVPFLAT